ncbi:PadR family transcriptional regulator [Microbacterium gorillae]|uniref:PadR family transcriptional regulator n=1 Tax=Microbacterium gorillae TaxID=1231063 RepID=UPI00058EE093|nr:PadR family transcriptional regulator [Microbacterium gorillae]
MAHGDPLEGHFNELRRGTVVLACLWLLTTPGYGYALLTELARHGFDTDANTLYPLLRRLEQQGYLTSDWNTDEARPRKFYRTTDAGARAAAALQSEWRALTGALDTLPRAARTPEPEQA